MALHRCDAGLYAVLMTIYFCCSAVKGNPSFTNCPIDINTKPDTDKNTATVYYAIPLAKDDRLAPAAVTCVPAPGTSFAGGNTAVKCTAKDTTDPSITTDCTLTVKVFPTFVAACPDLIKAAKGDGSGKTTVAYTVPKGAKDSLNKDAGVTCKPDGSTPFKDGEKTLVTCTATDSEVVTPARTATCTFYVTVGTKPTVTCPAKVLVAPQPELNTGIYTVPLPTANAGETVTCVADPTIDGTNFPAGDTVVTCTVRDNNIDTLFDTCDFTVGVYPTIDECPNIGPLGTGTTKHSITTAPVVTHSPGGAGLASCDAASKTLTDKSETEITCTVTEVDSPSRTATCTFFVTVGPGPTFADKMACKTTNVKVALDAGGNTATFKEGAQWYKPTTSDTDATVTCEADPTNDGNFPPGETMMTCTVRNTNIDTLFDTCSFTVQVYPAFIDNKCPDDITTSPDSDENTATIAWVLKPEAKGPGVATVVCDTQSGSLFNGGETNVTCTATQPMIGSATCTFKVNVYPSFDVCPDISLPAAKGSTETAVMFAELTASVDQGGADRFPVTCSQNSGDLFENGKTKEVTCTATDPKTKLTATCKFSVKIGEGDATTCMTTGGGCACDTSNTVCACNTGYSGPSCSVQDGTECTGPGNGCGSGCTNDGKPCACNAGKQGPLCDAVDHGSSCPGKVGNCKTCFGTGGKTLPCICEARFQGADCNTGDASTCTSTDGRCVCLSSECACKEGFSGPDCKVVDGSSCASTTSPCVAIRSDSCIHGFQGGSCESVDNAVECTGETDQPEHCGKCFGTSGTESPCICEDGWLGPDCAAEDGDLIIVCPADVRQSAEDKKNAKDISWVDPIPAFDSILCIPKKDTKFEFGKTTVVCTAFKGERRGKCTFDVNVEGPDCTSPECTGNFECKLSNKGQPVCECIDGYEGDSCERSKACKSNPCNANADCTEKPEDVDPYKCKCKDGFIGDGEFVCDSNFVDSYPDIPNAVKSFSVTITITTSFGCEPATNKNSEACIALIATFRLGVETLYKEVAPDSFKSLSIDQAGIREGSVIVPHSVTYRYGGSVKSMGTEEFYRKSVKKNIKAGAVGSLTVDTTALVSETTDACGNSTVVSCTGKEVAKKEETPSSCKWVCTTQCSADANYCNGGVCAQPKSDADAKCSNCPDGKGGVRCKEDDGPDIPLIVGLSVGLGGAALILIGIIVYCVCKQKNLKAIRIDSASEEGHGSNVALAMSPQSS